MFGNAVVIRSVPIDATDKREIIVLLDDSSRLVFTTPPEFTVRPETRLNIIRRSDGGITVQRQEESLG